MVLAPRGGPQLLRTGAVAGMLLLAACAQPGGYPGAALSEKAPSGSGEGLEAHAAPPPLAAGGKLALPAAVARGAMLAAIPVAAKRTAGPAGVPTPEDLKGLAADELAAMLGAPSLLSRDGPAQIWQYAGGGCVLHVFLYDERGTFRVTYAELRVDDREAARPPFCVERRRRPQASAGISFGKTTLGPGALPAGFARKAPPGQI